MGMAGVNALRADGEDAKGVRDAVDFIAELRQAKDLSKLPVGRRVVVLGGGMTAVDAAVQSKLLGAEEVTIAYRRGKDDMNASEFEQDLATANGVMIRHWMQPKKVVTEKGKVTGIELEYTSMKNGKLAGTGETLTLAADQVLMADIRNNFVGIKSPNPFWLASAPPTDKAYNVEPRLQGRLGRRGLEDAGRGGPPVVNVNGPRYGAIWGADRRLLGLNNIELITDRELQTNLRRSSRSRSDWPDRALVVSLMVPCEEDSWKAILPRRRNRRDGIELNFGCPHGMSERGMGAAVGQVPEYIEMVVRWCKQYTRMPVITKLTPNITDIRKPARAAKKGGTDAVSLINTINSITSVDLDSFAPSRPIDGKGSHGGYCGPAVKPIALNMVAEIARDPETRGLPISGIGGITTWRDAAEFMALGAGNVQVCTAAMTYGFKIVEEMIDGPEELDGREGLPHARRYHRPRVPNVTDWQYLNLNYIAKAHIDQDACIKCGRCHIACEDTSHQAITQMKSTARHFEVMEDECVGCNLCVNVCPVEAASPWSRSPLARSTSAPARRFRRPTPTGRRIPTIRWRGLRPSKATRMARDGSPLS
jgi:dihydropyrimidine dehydrogenase (NAD+) subunit PreA